MLCRDVPAGADAVSEGSDGSDGERHGKPLWWYRSVMSCLQIICQFDTPISNITLYDANIWSIFFIFTMLVPISLKRNKMMFTHSTHEGDFSDSRHCPNFQSNIRHWGWKLLDIRHSKISSTLGTLPSKGKKKLQVHLAHYGPFFHDFGLNRWTASCFFLNSTLVFWSRRSTLQNIWPWHLTLWPPFSLQSLKKVDGFAFKYPPPKHVKRVFEFVFVNNLYASHVL